MDNKDLEIFDDQVDRFLRHQMTEEEEKAFKQQLAETPELKQRARAIALMIREMQNLLVKNDRRIINTINGMSEDEFCEVTCEPEIEPSYPIRVEPFVHIGLGRASAFEYFEYNEDKNQDVANRIDKPIKKRPCSKFVTYAAAACVVGLIISFVYYLSPDRYFRESEYYKNELECVSNFDFLEQLANISYNDYEMYLSDDTRGENEAEDNLKEIFTQVRWGILLKPEILQLEALYQKAIDGDIDYAMYKDDIAWNLAIAYLKSGDCEKSLTLLEGIVENKKDYGTLANVRGEA